jgi:serine/threonine-protein kinase
MHNWETVPTAWAEKVPDRVAVAQEMERIAASENFRKADQCMRLLRYLTGRALEGRENELKEYTIAVDVFERAEGFDSRTDPVVRLEARRLRLKLAEYYQNGGMEDPVLVELPKGTYVPSFRFRRVLESPPPAAPAPAPPVRRSRPLEISVAALSVAIVMATAVYLVRQMRPGRAPLTVAVLPFQDNSTGQTLDYFAGGLRDGLTSALVHSKGLDVTARVSSGQRGDARENPVDAARRLQADTVVTGSVSPVGNEIQVVVGLVDAKSGKYLWSKTYQATTPDLPLIERGAASGIAHALGAAAEAPVNSLPANAEALELYLHAISLARTRLPGRIQDAARLFERAIALQPDFAPAYAAAASNCLVGVHNGILPWNAVAANCTDLARKAVDLDPTLAEAHTARAQSLQTQWKWQECDAELVRAIELDPRSPVPHFRKAFTLTILRRFAEAEKEIEIARGLDPSWIAATGLLGELYYYEHRFDDALALSKRYRGADPLFDNITARLYIAQRKGDLARPFLAKPTTFFEQALARAIGGDVQGAYRDLLEKRRSAFVPAYHMASFSVLELHDRETTLGWLEKSLEEHDPDLVSLALDPMFDGIRGEPRAVAILRQLNLGPASN